MTGPEAEALTERAAALLAEHADEPPVCGIVLGSGLAGLAGRVEAPIRLAWSDVRGFPAPGVAGHGGAWILGRLSDRPVLLQAGRIHLYEGHAPELVALPVRVMARLGVPDLLLTAATGGIRPGLDPGDLVLVDDVLNMTFRSPLTGSVRRGEARFPDLSRPLDPEFADVIRSVATDGGIPLDEGVYAAVQGPQYETAAEIRMLARLGADVVGMSTVPEVIAGVAAGMRVGAIAVVTNRATGLSVTPLDHEEVLEVGARAGRRLESLVASVVARLDPRPAQSARGDTSSGSAK